MGSIPKPGEVIKGAIFKKEPLEDGKFIELENWKEYTEIPKKVMAGQLTEDMFVKTYQGIRHGKKGDWVVQNDKGRIKIVSDKYFREMFE